MTNLKSKFFKITTIIIFLILFFSLPSFSKDLIINYLDVGNGNCQFIQLPDKKNILIDSGNVEASSKVIKYLIERHIKNIDLLIISNPSIENCGGLLKLSKIFPISEVFNASILTSSPSYLKLLNQFSSNNTRMTIVRKGQVKKYSDGIRLDVLFPPKTLIRNSISDIRNNSLVIKLSHKKNSFLFAGDIQGNAQNFLLDNIKDNLSSNVIKLPNFINRNEININFLDSVKPKIAIISSGHNPNLELLKILKIRNIKVYRTDKDGDITIVSDGENINLTNIKIDNLKLMNKISKINLNSARIEELELLPYINPPKSINIINLRKIKSWKDLKKIGLNTVKINEIKKFASFDIKKTKKFDINTASFQEIKNTYGVSDSLAVKIIENRPYSSILDLLKIEEINAKKFKELLKFAKVN